jgi:hypothetical protein
MRESRPAEFNSWLGSAARSAIERPVEDEKFALDAAQLAAKGLPSGVTLGRAEGGKGAALHFTKESGVPIEFPRSDADKAFSISTWIQHPKNDNLGLVVASQTDSKDKNRGWALEITRRVPALRLTGDDGKGIVMRSGHLVQLKVGEWHHVAVTYDGSREQAGMNIYIDGRAVETQGAGDQTTKLEGSIGVDTPLWLGGQKGAQFGGGAIADFRVYDRVITQEEALIAASWPMLSEALRQPASSLSNEALDGFRLFHLNRFDQAYRATTERLAGFAQERREIRRRGGITHVMHERSDRDATARILYRGMYDQPREKVAAATPSVLPPMPAKYPRNRLGLAQWLVDESNPLTARVTVNRFWQQVFGTGLVQTADDFGSQGEPPSHPELLDWLAVEFRESGWDTKHMFRLMVTSTAYRQSAAATPAKLEKDPNNRLLSRGPRFRLDGEVIRDAALAASSLLSPQIGGPSVKPYQPEGIWETVAMLGSNTRFYRTDDGDKLYRRSMYTFWKRAAPPPNMEIFNAPTREVCTVRRERTNTPLQALVTMNDVQFVEAARRLAAHAMQSSELLDARLDYLTSRVLARPFGAKEREITTRAYRDFMSYYDAHPDEARKLVAAGASDPDSALNATELASMTMVANQVMNLDEALNK